MAINADKTDRWKADVGRSVDYYNDWFLEFAPKTYRQKRLEVMHDVEAAMVITRDLSEITPEVLRASPGILPMLRMATCPPLAKDRIVGLAHADKTVVQQLERGKLPKRIAEAVLSESLRRIALTVAKLLDRDMFPWLLEKTDPSESDRSRAVSIVADRMCGAQADPLIRNEQERRQLKAVGEYLAARGYTQRQHPKAEPLTDMPPGTFGLRMGVTGIQIDRAGEHRQVNIPIDVVIQPHKPRRHRIPILMECKSAGDYTNVNKRRKEEATKIAQIHRNPATTDAEFVLFLCGYFDGGYLGYEATEGIDWIWEHRIEDMEQLGL